MAVSSWLITPELAGLSLSADHEMGNPKIQTELSDAKVSVNSPFFNKPDFVTLNNKKISNKLLAIIISSNSQLKCFSQIS